MGLVARFAQPAISPCRPGYKYRNCQPLHPILTANIVFCSLARTIQHNRINMNRRIAHVSLLVDDYDKAIAYYTQKLDFVLLEDTRIADDKRWVIVAPDGAADCSLLLAKATADRQLARIGDQAGGRVFLFLFTDHFWQDYHKLKERDVVFVREPETQDYGTVAVFEDLYGNRWDLIQPSQNNKGVMRC